MYLLESHFVLAKEEMILIPPGKPRTGDCRAPTFKIADDLVVVQGPLKCLFLGLRVTRGRGHHFHLYRKERPNVVQVTEEDVRQPDAGYDAAGPGK